MRDDFSALKDEQRHSKVFHILADGGSMMILRVIQSGYPALRRDLCRARSALGVKWVYNGDLQISLY